MLRNVMAEEQITRFIAFCIEQYKHRHGGDDETVYDLFDATGVLRFLEDNFEVEHALDAEMIVDDIEMIVNRHSKGVSA